MAKKNNESASNLKNLFQQVLDKAPESEKQPIGDKAEKPAAVNPGVVFPEVKTSFYIDEELLDLVKRAAYWDRTFERVIWAKAARAFLEGKNYPPIPEDQQVLRGRPSKKR